MWLTRRLDRRGMLSFAHARRSSRPRVASSTDPQETEANRRAVAAQRVPAPSEQVRVDRRQPDEQRLTGAASVGLRLDRLVAPGVASSLASGFGHSLSHVRLHTDDVAANAASNIGARAFTVGSDIYFGAHEFYPGSPSGMSLLAHELAHTLQPGSSASPVARRQPRDVAETAQQESSLPYPEEPALLKEAIEAAKAGGLSAGTVLGGGHPKAMALGSGAMVVGPLTSDMGPIYYVYRFGGREAQNLYLVTRAIVVPKDWSAGPTSAELDQAQGGQVLHVSGPEAIVPRGFTSKQQRWEYEFQRDYPRYRDVGGGGDPWGATDEGVMTETGVRVPRVAGHTLLRRPFYESRMAAFFAYQGFVHYAELIEAGQGKAALMIAQSLYSRTGQQIPMDSDLDLWAQTGWARRAAAARQTVQFGVMVSEIAIAAGRIWSSLRRPRPGAPPTTLTGKAATSEITTLTNVSAEIPAADVLSKYTIGSGFSGAYNPATKSWVALASGDAKLVSGGPLKTVPVLGGHANAEAALVARTGITDTSNNVGFVLSRQGENTLQIRWNSGTINTRNFGNRAAPQAYRSEIKDAVQKTTGFKVVE
jgi:hypothetical protein